MAVLSAVVVTPSGVNADEINVAQSITFTATPTGGVGTIHYQWKKKIGAGSYGNVGTDQATFAFVPVVGDIASDKIKCECTDEDTPPTVLDSNEVTIVVTATEVQTISMPVAAITIVLGEVIHFVGVTTGGSTVASNDWTVDTVSQAHNAVTFDFTPTSIGDFSVKFKATDGSDADNKTTDDLSVAIIVSVVSINTAFATAAGYLAKIAAAV